MIVLGLTGSIGMGKSTTARMFREAGVPVHDADEAVHRLYAGEAVVLVEREFPGVAIDGRIDRDRLGARVLGNPDALKRLEAIVHPLVRADADRFLREARNGGAALAVLDIPLLFETGGRERVDQVLVVTASQDVQRARVLARPGMTAEKFEAILARQVPDSEKRKAADFIIDTGDGMEAARREVMRVIAALTSKTSAQGLGA
ncbi:MAG: dephospho-CoA kinase [Mesorhizobium amorphae]|nr:MAG: dephospho-CoA kinase [Mesorhizobium amorphae]